MMSPGIGMKVDLVQAQDESASTRPRAVWLSLLRLSLDSVGLGRDAPWLDQSSFGLRRR